MAKYSGNAGMRLVGFAVVVLVILQAIEDPGRIDDASAIGANSASCDQPGNREQALLGFVVGYGSYKSSR